VATLTRLLAEAFRKTAYQVNDVLLNVDHMWRLTENNTALVAVASPVGVATAPEVGRGGGHASVVGSRGRLDTATRRSTRC
jgi:hypothetical protein